MFQGFLRLHRWLGARKRFPLKWGQLRNVGNIPALKTSYAVFLLAPILAEAKDFLSSVGVGLFGIVMAFVAYVSLAIANLTYDLACPVIQKRFASSNDLYREMLDIKVAASTAYPNDTFDASQQHCRARYSKDNSSRPLSRLVASISYLVAAGALGLLMLERAADFVQKLT